MRDGLGGVSLRRVLQSTPLTSGQAIAVGNAVLARVESLHANGLYHGAIHPETVRIARDGTVRLSEPPSDHALLRGYPQMAADIRSCGLLICAAFGVDPMRRAVPASSGLGPEALAAIQAARNMVQGSLGQDSARAWSELIEASGSLGRPEELAQSHSQLGELVRSLRGLGLTLPALAEWWRHPVARLQLQSRRPRPRATVKLQSAFQPLPGSGLPRRGLISLLAVVAVLLVVGLAIGIQAAQRGAPGRPQAAAQASPTAAAPTPSPASAPRPSPTPPAAPAPGPGAAVTAIELSPQGSCAPGSACQIEVTVRFPSTNKDQDIAWSFTVTDKCANKAAERAGTHVNAQSGWNHVIADSSVDLPPSKQVLVVVTTTSPDRFASAPLVIGSGC